MTLITMDNIATSYMKNGSLAFCGPVNQTIWHVPTKSANSAAGGATWNVPESSQDLSPYRSNTGLEPHVTGSPTIQNDEKSPQHDIVNKS